MMATREMRSTVHGVLLGAVGGINFLLSISFNAFGLTLLIGKSVDIASCVVSSVVRGLQASFSYTLTLVSLERTLHLFYPLKRYSFCSPAKSRIICVAVILTCLLVELTPNLFLVFKVDLSVPVSIFFCPVNFGMTLFHVIFVYALPIVHLIVDCVLLVRKLSKRREQVKKNTEHDSENFKLVLERIQTHNQLTITCICLFVHFILTSLAPMVIHICSLSGIEPSELGRQTAEVLTNIGESTVLMALLTNEYFRRTFYQVLCIRDVQFEASFGRSKTDIRRKGQERLECGLPDNRKTCYRVVGLKLSSEKSSTGQALEESNETAAVSVAVISGSKEASSPTEVILSETAVRLTHLGATYLN
jgi:hypothetical protein